jgi:diaminohydroxyphosphoribosylaminopyrimidine deaminase/5-amino-6-(5-phosphoribosylamino)uracil reductase
MQRALQLAALGAGRTSPNPMVGALVLAADGQLVGEGYHARAGEAHAELGALAQAGERARGGTLVVTLEPCCHQGRTPPCSRAVIGAGIARVVLAMADPNPLVAGQGIAELRAAGLEVIEGVCGAEAQALNRAFCHRIATGRPATTPGLRAAITPAAWRSAGMTESVVISPASPRSSAKARRTSSST